VHPLGTPPVDMGMVTHTPVLFAVGLREFAGGDPSTTTAATRDDTSGALAHVQNAPRNAGLFEPLTMAPDQGRSGTRPQRHWLSGASDQEAVDLCHAARSTAFRQSVQQAISRAERSIRGIMFGCDNYAGYGRCGTLLAGMVAPMVCRRRSQAWEV
jgi:hypothetical protein